MVDEAYADYVEDPRYGSMDRLVRQEVPIVVVRSFSKLFGLNLDHVERVDRAGDDSFCVHLRGLSDPVPMSRRYAARLRTRGV
jgi:hypothetical protein